MAREMTFSFHPDARAELNRFGIAGYKNISGSFRRAQWVYNQSATFLTLSTSITLAPVGQFFTQAWQRMHRSGSVITAFSTTTAAVGQTEAQVPQRVQRASRVVGASMGRFILSL